MTQRESIKSSWRKEKHHFQGTKISRRTDVSAERTQTRGRRNDIFKGMRGKKPQIPYSVKTSVASRARPQPVHTRVPGACGSARPPGVGVNVELGSRAVGRPQEGTLPAIIARAQPYPRSSNMGGGRWGPDTPPSSVGLRTGRGGRGRLGARRWGAHSRFRLRS